MSVDVVYDAKCPYWDQASLNNTKTWKSSSNSNILFSVLVCGFCVHIHQDLHRSTFEILSKGYSQSYGLLWRNNF